MDKCKQVINGRNCTRYAMVGVYCHQHADQTLHARVGRRCNMSAGKVEEVVNALIEEMGWEEIDRFNAEFRVGQAEDDAGSYMLRCIGKLFGATGRYDHLKQHKRAAKALTTPPGK